MATLVDLARERRLFRVEVDLDPDQQPKRLLLALPRVMTWSAEELPNLRSDSFHDGASTPVQQAQAYTSLFVAGGDVAGLAYRPHIMKPFEKDVWVLKTPDLRFYGWFWRKGVFIISAADTKRRILDFGLASNYVDQVVNDRNSLPLDEPKFTSGELHELL